PGDTLQSAELSITSGENGGTSYFDQTVNFTQSGCVSNSYGYDVCNETASFSGPTLNSGTYWVNLQNASSVDGQPVYWDENSGPSSASENSVGTIPSESFTVLGTSTSTTTTTTTGTVPEPSSIMLFGSGILGLAGVLRRKLF
ncbi:MAG TPA: PEP-CTERM sorting domain-containing protein, partial [Terriglobales bacterium]|nr:PEP-CTERM sorting domain-containing protein [Terriglobales bacterium]